MGNSCGQLNHLSMRPQISKRRSRLDRALGPLEHNIVGIDSGVVLLSDEFGEKPFIGLRPAGNSTEAKTAKARVLVVDDEKMVADTTSEILDGAGFDAKAAYDGRTALEIAVRFRPDCLLTDVLMPRMNGVELAIAITKLLPAIRIVLFSGQAGIFDRSSRPQSRKQF